MFIVNSYTLAIIFCFITMICWGSWGNTQKLPARTGVMSFITGIIQSVSYYLPYFSFSHSEVSEIGRGFLEDIRQVDTRYIVSAIDRRNYFQCFQHLTFSFGLHSRNGGCFSVGRRTCLGPRCVHQLFQHS